MRTRLTLTAAAVAALSLAACGSEEARQEAAQPPATADAPGAAQPPPAATQLPAANTAAGFVSRMALSDMYEIESGRLALATSQDNDVKRFAQMMVDDHSRTSLEARAAVAQQGVQVTLPTALDPERQALMQELRTAAPAEFDARYAAQQAAAHERTLQLLTEYAARGDNPALRDFAGRTAQAVTNHLQMARALTEGAAGEQAGATQNNAGGQRR